MIFSTISGRISLCISSFFRELSSNFWRFSLSEDEISLHRLANIEEKMVSIRVVTRCTICLRLFLCSLHDILSQSDSRLQLGKRSKWEAHFEYIDAHMYKFFASGGPLGTLRRTASSPWCAARTTRWSPNYNPAWYLWYKYHICVPRRRLWALHRMYHILRVSYLNRTTSTKTGQNKHVILLYIHHPFQIPSVNSGRCHWCVQQSRPLWEKIRHTPPTKNTASISSKTGQDDIRSHHIINN